MNFCFKLQLKKYFIISKKSKLNVSFSGKYTTPFKLNIFLIKSYNRSSDLLI